MAITLKPIFVDIEHVTALLDLSESTVQALVRSNEFPRPRKASPRSARWLLREIEEWAESRPHSDLLPPENTAAGGRKSRPKARPAIQDSLTA